MKEREGGGTIKANDLILQMTKLTKLNLLVSLH